MRYASWTPRWVAAALILTGGSAAAERRQPQLVVTPANLSFSAPEGGPNPVPQAATVRNNDTGNMDWSAASGAAWLSVTPSGGRLHTHESQEVQVSVNVAGLGAGTHNGTITFTAPNSQAPTSRTLQVSLTVSAGPAIGLSATSLTFNAPLNGPDPAAQNVTVTNVGGGTLAWNADDAGKAWLSQTPASGFLAAGASAGMTVAVAVSGLPAGQHLATITVSGEDAVPRTISVTLNVSALPVIAVSPAGLLFEVPFGWPDPISQTVQVRNAGGGTLNWSADDAGAAWLAQSPASGSLGAGAEQAMTVTVAPAGLAEGGHAATVTVSASGAASKTVSVTVNVSAAPRIGLNPVTLTFAAASGAGPPPVQAVSVTNSGGGTLGWSASPDAPWIVVSPASGSLGAVTSEPMSVTVDPSGLAEGVYSGTILLSAPGASNTPQLVSVAAQVGPAPAAAAAERVAAGQCGSVGLDLAAPLILLAGLRRRRKGAAR